METVGWLLARGRSRSHEQISTWEATSDSSRSRTGSASAPSTRASSFASPSASGASVTEPQHNLGLARQERSWSSSLASRTSSIDIGRYVMDTEHRQS